MSQKPANGSTNNLQPIRRLAQGACYADNYGVEIVGLDEIESSVLISELVLIMGHLKADTAADNYFTDKEG